MFNQECADWEDAAQRMQAPQKERAALAGAKGSNSGTNCGARNLGCRSGRCHRGSFLQQIVWPNSSLSFPSKTAVKAPLHLSGPYTVLTHPLSSSSESYHD